MQMWGALLKKPCKDLNYDEDTLSIAEFKTHLNSPCRLANIAQAKQLKLFNAVPFRKINTAWKLSSLVEQWFL